MLNSDVCVTLTNMNLEKISILFFQYLIFYFKFIMDCCTVFSLYFAINVKFPALRWLMSAREIRVQRHDVIDHATGVKGGKKMGFGFKVLQMTSVCRCLASR